MTQVLEEMRRSQQELRGMGEEPAYSMAMTNLHNYKGAQLNLAGPIAEKFDELQAQLFNSQNILPIFLSFSSLPSFYPFFCRVFLINFRCKFRSATPGETIKFRT